MKLKYTPLPSSFMIISMLGIIISAVYVNSGKLNSSYGVSFIIIFLIMFISSMISMAKSPVEELTEIDKR